MVMQTIDTQTLMTPARTGFALAFMTFGVALIAQLPPEFAMVPVALGLVIALCEPMRHMALPKRLLMLLIWPYGLATLFFLPFLGLVATQGQGMESTLQTYWPMIFHMGLLLYGLSFITLCIGDTWGDFANKYAGRHAFVVQSIPTELVMYGLSTMLMIVLRIVSL